MVSIIYEDNHLLIVEKPINVPSQLDASGDPDFLTILKDDIKKRNQKPGNVYLGLVHRLDRPVGGVMVFAKTSKAASRLSESIRSHQFKKVYYAVVHGHPRHQQGELTHYLLKNNHKNIVSVVSEHSPNAKKATLTYECVAQLPNLSLMRIDLQTGRPHQIRVQMQAIGCPLFGDQKYGVDVNKKNQQLALWSSTLSFTHPTTKELVTFHSTPPFIHPWSLWPKTSYI